MPTKRARTKSRSVAPIRGRAQIARAAKTKSRPARARTTPRTKRSATRLLFVGADRAALWRAARAHAAKLKVGVKRVALSAVVSRHFGETEKNLSALFAVAVQSGTILYFDEGDALFGKRTEVKDSHDRYATQEVSYLLQRLEDYQGMVILATNGKTDLPPELQRRFRRVVKIPAPKR